MMQARGTTSRQNRRCKLRIAVVNLFRFHTVAQATELANKPISDEELAHAKTRRLRGYAQQFESLARITSQIGNLWTLGLPMTELQCEYDATGKVTLEQVSAATKKYARPEASSILLVGDRSKIEPALRDLKPGEIVVLDVQGKAVAAGTR